MRAAWSVAVSAQNHVSSTSSGRGRSRATTATTETTSVSCRGSVYFTDQMPSTTSAICSPIQPARMTSASDRESSRDRALEPRRAVAIDSAAAAASDAERGQVLSRELPHRPLAAPRSLWSMAPMVAHLRAAAVAAPRRGRADPRPRAGAQVAPPEPDAVAPEAPQPDAPRSIAVGVPWHGRLEHGVQLPAGGDRLRHLGPDPARVAQPRRRGAGAPMRSSCCSTR